MIEIKGYPGYYLDDDGMTIIGKKKKPLKTKFNCVILQQNGRRTCVPVNKLVLCALRGVAPDEIPKGYSFRMIDGRMVAETFSDRMSYVKRKNTKKVRISDEQILYLERYIQILKDIRQDTDDAKAKLFMLINEDREQFIAYACKLSYNNRENAEIVADSAIMATMDVICNNEVMVPNPRGCVKSFIRGFLRENRKFSDLKDEERLS